MLLQCVYFFIKLFKMPAMPPYLQGYVSPYAQRKPVRSVQKPKPVNTANEVIVQKPQRTKIGFWWRAVCNLKNIRSGIGDVFDNMYDFVDRNKKNGTVLINPAFDIDLNRSGNYKDNVNKLVMEEFHLHVQQMKVGETKYIVLPGPIKGNYIANSNKHFMPLTVQKTKNGCVIQHDKDNMPTWLEKYTKEPFFSRTNDR